MLAEFEVFGDVVDRRVDCQTHRDGGDHRGSHVQPHAEPAHQAGDDGDREGIGDHRDERQDEAVEGDVHHHGDG